MAIHFDTQGPAPDGFHVPTKDEWATVCNTGFSLGAWTYNNANNLVNYLKLPGAGYRDYRNANVSYQGYNFYWSSSRYDENFAHSLSIGVGSPTLQPQKSSYRSFGFPVRCFKDKPVTPDNNRTQLYDGGDGPQGELTGIYHNATLGLISISSDGTNRITIQDKNLGATTVWNNGDTLSEANCGYYYQRGNNYGFPFTGDVTTSGSQVDASAYGPGNYYSSSTFITGNQRWDTTDNGNLRGGVSQGTWETPDPVRLHGAIQTFHRAPKPPTSITLNESAIIFSAVGDTQQLTVTVSPGDASTDFIWSSNDTSIATVSNTGLVTCISLGNCVITCTAKYGSATASCSVINPENVTMTNTSYSLDATYTSLTTTLFTASKTGYYHITGTFWARSQAGGATGATHNLSGGEYKSGTNSGWTDPGRSIAVDCVYYIETGTELKGYVETYGYTSGGGSNFAAEFWGDYDPSQSSSGGGGVTSGAAIQ